MKVIYGFDCSWKAAGFKDCIGVAKGGDERDGRVVGLGIKIDEILAGEELPSFCDWLSI